MKNKKNAAIIAVGEEVLCGEILDSNSAFISSVISEVGFLVRARLVTGDSIYEIKKALEFCYSEADAYITFLCGGLGPTRDDLTKEAVAEYFSESMLFNEKVWQNIKDFYKTRNLKEIPENNKRQALFPENSEILDNPNGTAPGLFLVKNERAVICLPGPPRELKPMLLNLPILNSGFKKYTRVIKSVTLGESLLASKIDAVIKREIKDVYIGVYASEGEVAVRITARVPEAISKADEAANEALKILGLEVFEGDAPLEKIVIDALIQKNVKIAVAESVTGGMLTAALVNVDGASKVFSDGYITYSDESKIRRLGVSPEIIKKYGAVSEETALAMAEGAIKESGAEISVALTGFAEKGLCYIAVNYKGKNKSNLVQVFGERNQARRRMKLRALDFIRRALNNL